MNGKVIQNLARKNLRKKSIDPYLPEYERLGMPPIHVSGRRQPGMVEAAPKRKEQPNRPILDKEIELPQELQSRLSRQREELESQEISEIEEVQEEQQMPDDILSSLKEGDYCLLIDGNVVCSFGKVEDASSFIQQVLFDEVPELSGVTKDQMTLLKTVPIKFGVYIKE